MPAIDLDRTDRRILDLLQRDAKLSNQESPSASISPRRRACAAFASSKKAESFVNMSRCSTRPSWDWG